MQAYANDTSCRAVHDEETWQGPSFNDIVKVSGNSERPGQPARLLAVFHRATAESATQQVLVAVTVAYPSSPHLSEMFWGWTHDGLYNVCGTICYHAVGRRSRTHISLKLTPIEVPASPSAPPAQSIPDVRLPDDTETGPARSASHLMAAAASYLLNPSTGAT